MKTLLTGPSNRAQVTITSQMLTINAWAIDEFTKIFWRDEPVSHLWPQVLVLLGTAIVLFAIASRVARRCEFA